MKALHIIIPSSGKDFYTSDLVDVINELETLPDGEKVEITVQTMTPQQFTKLTEDTDKEK